MNKTKIFKLRDCLIVTGVLLALMIVGSFLDYQISVGLFNIESGFGIFFAAYGEYPTAILAICCGMMLILVGNQNKVKRVFQIIGGAFMLSFGLGLAIVMPIMYLTVSKALTIVIALLICGGTAVGVWQLSKNADKNLMFKIAICIVVVLFAQLIIVNIIKIPWGRPRMRLVATDERATFVPWWIASSDLKNQLTALGVASDEFKSFPSGHTANSATFMLFELLPLLTNYKHKNRVSVGLFYGGVVWALVVALSRIVMGAHYLTDTIVGFAVTFISIIIATKIIFKTKKETNYEETDETRTS